MPKLTPKQQRFVEEYPIDLNATQAATRAGYSERTARAQGARLLTNVDIQSAVMTARAAMASRNELTVDWVISTLRENVARALQAEPILDRQGNPTGEYVYQGAVVNKAMELLGRHIGMWPTRIEHSGPQGGPIQFVATKNSQAEEAEYDRLFFEQIAGGEQGVPATDGDGESVHPAASDTTPVAFPGRSAS